MYDPKRLRQYIPQGDGHNSEFAVDLVDAADELEAVAKENELLRGIYEAARRTLRYYGVDAGKAVAAAHELDDAIERMKLHDSGLDEEIY